MKRTIAILVLCWLSGICMAQKGYPIIDEYGNPVHYGVNSLNSKISLTLQADKFTTAIKPFNEIPNDPLGKIVYLEGTKNVLLTALVRKDSLNYYRYSIIENDTNMVVNNALLSKVNFVWDEGSSYPGYLTMDLEVSSIANKKITVKIYKVSDASQVTTLILYNKSFRPAKISGLAVVARPSVAQVSGRKAVNNSFIITNGAAFNINEYADHIFVSMKKTDLDFAYQLHFTQTDRGGHVTVNTLSNQWRYDSADGNPYLLIDASYFREPGEYEIAILPQSGLKAPRSLKTTPRVTFTVLPAPRIYTTRDVLMVALVILIFLTLAGGLIIFVGRKRSKARLLEAQRKTESVKSELDQVRAQLNPHFVYNSLSGIQNLMNQNEVEEANAYLSKFARLTRSILDERDLIALQDEYKLLDDYLAMERLRFKFNYEIKLSDEVNFLEIEIPAMLLQPFVENATKHSMSMLRDKGDLLVEFKSVGKNLVLSVKDNGKGFDLHHVHAGLGLTLCKKRIALLNKIYTECPISLEINSGSSGTTVVVTLNNWL